MQVFSFWGKKDLWLSL